MVEVAAVVEVVEEEEELDKEGGGGGCTMYHVRQHTAVAAQGEEKNRNQLGPVCLHVRTRAG